MRVRDHFRAHGRKPVTLRAALRGDSPASGKSTPSLATEDNASIRNLGLGGACVELPLDSEAEGQLLRLDAAIHLEVMSPTLWDPLVLRGRIAWLRRSTADRAARVGIRFEHQEEGSLFALFQLLASTPTA